MTFSKKLGGLAFALVMFTGFVGYSFLTAYDESVWFPPENGSTAPQNNVSGPLNTGSSTQTKTGNLIIGNMLGLFGGQPSILFSNNDPAIPKWVIRSDMNGGGDTYMKFLYDRDNNLNAADDNPSPLTIFTGRDAANDYSIFSNQVWAKEYCDRSGGNCIDPNNPTEVDLSVIHTYSIKNNIRSVSGAACSCYEGDSLTSCNANGQPMINSDVNACSPSPAYSTDVICTCLAVKPSPKLCTVTISGSSVHGSSNTRTIQVLQGAYIRIGAWYNGGYYMPQPDVRFTGGPISSYVDSWDPINHSRFYTNNFTGYWTSEDFAKYGDVFTSIPSSPNSWNKSSVTVHVVPNAPSASVNLYNSNMAENYYGTNYVNTCQSTITATVGVCQ